MTQWVLTPVQSCRPSQIHASVHPLSQQELGFWHRWRHPTIAPQHLVENEYKPPCSASARWRQTWASRLLLRWQLQLGAYSVGFGLFVCFFFPSYVAIWDSKTHHRPAGERISWCLETSPSQLPPWDGSLSLTLVSLFVFYILSYLLSKRMGYLVLCQSSEVVLWKLLSVQMIFWWICGGESGLLVLFLCHVSQYKTF